MSASNGKGHGIHSPFVFDFIQKVLRDKQKYPCYSSIENERRKLLSNETIIEVEDFGAGSSMIKSKKRKVKDIAATSLKPRKYAQLLYRIVQYYQPATIVELGTSLGITTAYLSAGNKNAKLYSFEGSANISTIARATFDSLQIKNIEIIQGDFAKTLPLFRPALPFIDLVFIDGNHRKEPTLQYFNDFLGMSNDHSILIFDDIHWSSEMEEAWSQIQQHPAVTLTIDLFFIGLVFINPDFKVHQHFIIRF